MTVDPPGRLAILALDLGKTVHLDGIEIQLEGDDATLGSNVLTAAVDGKDGAAPSGALVYLTISISTTGPWPIPP